MEPQIIERSLKYFPTAYRGGDLIGLDVMIDENFKPWLLEVNLLPQMTSLAEGRSQKRRNMKGRFRTGKPVRYCTSAVLQKYTPQYCTCIGYLCEILSGEMIQELLNMESLHLPCQFNSSEQRRIMSSYGIPGDKLCLDLGFFRLSRTVLELAKEEHFLFAPRTEYLHEILEDLTTGMNIPYCGVFLVRHVRYLNCTEWTGSNNVRGEL